MTFSSEGQEIFRGEEICRRRTTIDRERVGLRWAAPDAPVFLAARQSNCRIVQRALRQEPELGEAEGRLSIKALAAFIFPCSSQTAETRTQQSTNLSIDAVI
jgi:hypothetical protein